MAVADPDWTDPCAVLGWLTPQYYRVLAGQQEISIEYGGRKTDYSQANVAALTALKLQLEDECRLRSGLPGRRRAIVAG